MTAAPVAIGVGDRVWSREIPHISQPSSVPVVDNELNEEAASKAVILEYVRALAHPLLRDIVLTR
jgi:hypothetical protein